MISRVARSILPISFGRILPVRHTESPEDHAAARHLIGRSAEFRLIETLRCLPSSAAVAVEPALFPAVYRATVLGTAVTVCRLDRAAADPALLADKTDIYVLATAPHRDVIRKVSAAVPGARVRSVVNDWLPDLIATSGLFQVAPADLHAPGAGPAPDVRYMIFALPRSGSYYLCEMLYRAGLGVPKEHLRPMTEDLFAAASGFRPLAFADNLVRQTTRNGYFGTKLIAHYLLDAIDERPGRLHLLRRWIDRFGVRLVYLDRRDLALQAVSAVVALKKDSWRLVDPAKVAELRPPAYDFARLYRFYDMFRRDRRRLETLLEDQAPVHRLAYEDLDRDPLGSLNGVLGFLAAPAVARLPDVETLKVRNDAILAFAERFRDDLRRRGET